MLSEGGGGKVPSIERHIGLDPDFFSSFEWKFLSPPPTTVPKMLPLGDVECRGTMLRRFCSRKGELAEVFVRRQFSLDLTQQVHLIS